MNVRLPQTTRIEHLTLNIYILVLTFNNFNQTRLRNNIYDINLNFLYDRQ